jgi:hypothetical protein
LLTHICRREQFVEDGQVGAIAQYMGMMLLVLVVVVYVAVVTLDVVVFRVEAVLIVTIIICETAD